MADRRAGFAEFLKTRGITPLIVDHKPFTSESGVEAVKSLLRAKTKFDAIFACNDLLAMGAIRALIELGVKRGEIRQATLADFPQIVVAPAIVGVIWKSLFERHAPLDAMAMLRVHLDLIFGERSAS